MKSSYPPGGGISHNTFEKRQSSQQREATSDKESV